MPRHICNDSREIDPQLFLKIILAYSFIIATVSAVFFYRESLVTGLFNLFNKLKSYKLEKLIARESVVPDSLTAREQVIILYSDCVNPDGLGDHSAGVSLAYFLQKQLGFPIVLLSGSDRDKRFNTLCKTHNADEEKIYDLPVRAFNRSTLNSTRFKIEHYIDIGCKQNDKEYIRRVMLRDRGKATFFGTLIQSPLDYKIHIMSKVERFLGATSTKSNIFTLGFADQNAGVSFTSYASFKDKMLPEDLRMTKLSDEVVTKNPGHGFFCISEGLSIQADILYALNYMQCFLFQKTSNLIIALGDAQIIALAALKLSVMAKKTVIIHNYITSGTVTFVDGKAIKNNDFDSNNLDPTLFPDNIYLLCSKGIPHAQLRRLLVNAGQLVGLSGATMAIDALGEGKLLFYECLKEVPNFLHDYCSAVSTANDPKLQELAELLVRRSTLKATELEMLQDLLASKELCAHLRTLHQSLVATASEKLLKTMADAPSESFLGYAGPTL